MGLSDVHRLWAFVCIGLPAACGLYAIWQLLRSRFDLRGLLILSAAGLAASVLQGLLGMMLVWNGGVPGKGWIHLLYGGILLVTFPALWWFGRGREPRAQAAAYAVLGVFLAGVAVRALLTGLA